MSKTLFLDLEDEETICALGAALSSPARLQVLKKLYFKSYSVAEIAEALSIPTSSAALYIRSLEQAGLINTYIQPGSKGNMKICSRKHDDIAIRLTHDQPDVSKVKSVSMPIGCFCDCKVGPTCGMASVKDNIVPDDHPENFYSCERVNASILWTATGYVEYKFPFELPEDVTLHQMILTFEACSEAMYYNEDWKSDITIWINGIECGTWRCPGDYGSRRGRLNPEWWPLGSTQHGLLVSFEINEYKTTINSEEVSDVKISDLSLHAKEPVIIRIGNKENAENIGGFNLFGAGFGDYDQDIILSYVYK